jgi:quinolinate synthase
LPTRSIRVLPSEIVLPESYRRMDERECKDLIIEHKKREGGRVVILGHHYQRVEIVRLSDIVGDSLELSRKASQSDAEVVVFCGVAFMAEAAGVLAKQNQTVVHPNPNAGCPLADSAEVDDVETAYEAFSSASDESIIPLVYMNSSSEIKAFAGNRSGAVCTSSNAAAAFRWGLEKGRVMFVPDEHLGRNSIAQLGIPDEKAALWDPKIDNGGIDPKRLRKARVLLWKGDCHVHSRFTVEQVLQAREQNPGARVVVHPECRREVVESADGAGSTSYLVVEANRAEPGSTIVIGTEINLVSRLAEDRPDVNIIPLARSLCPNMYKISLRYLLWTLDGSGSRHVVDVSEKIATGARKALSRMLEIA